MLSKIITCTEVKKQFATFDVCQYWKVQGHLISLTFDLGRHTHKMGLLSSVSNLTFHLDLDLLFKFRF